MRSAIIKVGSFLSEAAVLLATVVAYQIGSQVSDEVAVMSAGGAFLAAALTTCSILSLAQTAENSDKIVRLLEELRNLRTAPTPSADNVLPAGYEDELDGFPYRRLPKGEIEILTKNGPRKYPSWAAFYKAIRPSG